MSGGDAVVASAPRRYEVLDGVRGIAAISVMISHFQLTGTIPIFPHAPLAVDLFFMLSGFVICHSYGSRIGVDMKIPAYLSRRVIRLWPMFLLGIGIGTPILYVLIRSGLATMSDGALLQSLLCNAFWLPSLNHSTIANFDAVLVSTIFPVDPPLWSLFFEMVASILFPLLIAFRPRLLAATAATCFLVFLAIVYGSAVLLHAPAEFNQGSEAGNLVGGFPRVIFGFSLGIVIYRLSRHEAFRAALMRRTPRILHHQYALYILVFALFAFPKQLMGAYSIVFLILIAPAVILVGSQVDAVGAVGTRLAKFLGWISYPIYCLHYPVGRAVFLAYSTWRFPYPIAALVAVIAAFAVSVVLTKIYDEPVRAFLSKRLSRKAHAGAGLSPARRSA